MVMGDDSCLKGRGFESWRRILDELTFFKLICCKNCIDVCLKRPKINEKRPGLAQFFLKKVIIVIPPHMAYTACGYHFLN